MPYLLGAPFLGGGENFLLDVDFTSWDFGFYDATALHAKDYVAPTKSDLVLIRRYSAVNGTGQKGETVQISDSELIQSAASAQTDIARIGRRTSSSKRGLVIHPGYSNYAIAASTSLDKVQLFAPASSGSGTNAADTGGVGTSWTTDTSTPAVSGLGSASGLGNIAETCHATTSGAPNSSNFGAGFRLGSSSKVMRFSVWEKGSTEMCVSVDGLYLATRAASGTWGRIPLLLDGSHGSVSDYHPCEGRAAIAPALRDINATYVNVTRGPTLWEAITTCSGSYAGDRLRYLTGSALVATDGQLKFRAAFSPYFASTDQVCYDAAGTGGLTPINTALTNQAAWYLFSSGKDASTYAYVDASTKKVKVRVNGGSVYTSTNALAWAAHDEVEIFLAVGNGKASVAKYRLNGGTWADLVLATVSDAFSMSGFLAFFYNDDTATNGDGSNPVNAELGLGDGGQFGARIHRLSIYKGGGPPGT